MTLGIGNLHGRRSARRSVVSEEVFSSIPGILFLLFYKLCLWQPRVKIGEHYYLDKIGAINMAAAEKKM